MWKPSFVEDDNYLPQIDSICFLSEYPGFYISGDTFGIILLIIRYFSDST